MDLFAFKTQPDNMKITKCDRKKEFELDCIFLITDLKVELLK